MNIKSPKLAQVRFHSGVDHFDIINFSRVRAVHKMISMKRSSMESCDVIPASFSQMREAEELTDVSLVFDGTRVPCHKVILAGTCEYFKRMFLANLSESTAAEISIGRMSSATGVFIVEYLYSRSREITVENAQEILEASSMLMLDRLKRKVEEFLIRKIDDQNCISLLNIGRLFELKALINTTRMYLTDTLEVAIDTMQMEILQEEDLVYILEHHTSPNVCFSVLQKWVRLAKGSAEQFMALLRHVDLNRCSKQFIQSTVMNEEMMKSTQGLLIAQNAAMHKSLIVGDFHQNIWIRDDRDVWKVISRHPMLACKYSACASPRGIVFSGGEVCGKPMSECYSFCTRERLWSRLPQMIKARHSHSSIYYKNYLYILGGKRMDQHSTASVEIHNLVTRHRRQLTPLPESLHYCLVVSVSDRLFVLGGTHSQRGNSRNVYEYDSSQIKWVARASLPEDCNLASASAFEDKVMVVGGERMSCLMYEPLADCWAMLNRPGLLHCLGASLEFRGQVVLLGGQCNDSIEGYCPGTDKWVKWKLKLPSAGCLCFALEM
ncbi:hypothetical protein CAPTEDRAFT_213425 [Capitella teleta]|uniref:BTB domain-containing protein n=1 Tax=Capitella teleta TaxID=283909 RepID=R7UEA3_CAPTE|nr:hypothetical protein CAPTEDRAFT_213425 [Capitella teleta]|eukprot:ELU04864.1 hypothetical protein CAPTEDRAFT_213425 [Capitella teleta]